MLTSGKFNSDKNQCTVDGIVFGLTAHGGSGQGGYEDYIKLSKNKTYTLTLPAGFNLTNINVKGYTNNNGATNGEITSIGGVSQTGKTFPAKNDAELSTATQITTGYDFAITQTGGEIGIVTANTNQICVLITITGTLSAQTPVFSPSTGESVAEGSKITITSANSTSIKYKWTSDDTTPTGGWSTYDADAKVIVPAAAVGTTYLHAQGFVGENGGTAAYAQYTITAPDTEAPTLSSTSITNGETNIPLNGNVILTFNENIACSTNATLTPEGGEAINLTPIVDGATVTYAYSSLASNKAYTFNLAANSVEDLAGNKYASAINFGFTSIQETVATPTITIMNKVAKIECETDGATIYYAIGNAELKTTGSKSTYSSIFIPASNGTIYAYAEKAGYLASDVASKSYTAPTIGDVTGNLLVTLQPDAIPSSDTTYGSNTFTKAGYSMANSEALKNSSMDKYPNMFKASKGTFTITPPTDVTIQSLKIYGIANNESKTCNIQKETDAATVTSSDATLIPRYIYVGDAGVLTEVVVTVASPSEGGTVNFKVGGDTSEARLYVEVYGTTSATNETITPTKEYTTYVPTHNLDFTGLEIKAYVATAATASSVTLEEVTTVPAGTPLVLKKASAASYDVSVTASASAPATNLLKAGDGKTEIGGDGKYDYILSDGKFYHASAGTVAVGKAYLHLDSNPAGARSLDIDFGGTTGISQMEDVRSKKDDVYYDLQGRRVLYPTKGLYIVNGKKIILK